jgi:hypothetical protein
VFRFAPLFLLACADVAAPLPASLQGPPPVLSATTFAPGQLGSLIVEGADPFETVHFIRGTQQAPGPCIQTAGNLCLDIDDVVYMGRRRADGTGRAAFTVQIPPAFPPGTEGWFQSVLIRGPASEKSQALYVRVVGDDVDGDGFDAATDCDDDDPTVFPGALERCDGIDNDCDPTTTEDGRILVDGMDITAPYALDQALTQVQPGGTIELCAGTFPFTREFELTSPVTIRGQGMGQTVLDGGQVASRGFFVTTTGVEIEDLTVQRVSNSVDGNAIHVRCPTPGTCAPGDVLLRGLELRDNIGNRGPAVRIELGGHVRMLDSRVVGNFPRDGAVSVLDGSVLDVLDTVFSDNIASTGASAVDVDAGGVFRGERLSFLRNDSPSSRAIALDNDLFECLECDFGAGLDDNTPGDMLVERGTFSFDFYDWFGVVSMRCDYTAFTGTGCTVL